MEDKYEFSKEEEAVLREIALRHEAFLAVVENDTEGLKELLEKERISPDLREDSLNEPLLHMAVRKGKIPCVKLLLMHGAEVDICNDRRETALMLATGLGRLPVCRMLLNYGANIHRDDGSRRLAIHHAAQAGQAKTVDLLYEYGSQLNCRDVTLCTPMHLAASGGDEFAVTETLTVLLRAGAKPNLTDCEHHTPLDYLRGVMLPQAVMAAYGGQYSAELEREKERGE